MTERLDPLTLPLRGSVLIEASAGTGKTWTLAALVLRLVLGHGEVVCRDGRGLMPRDILVMTFTRAATRELNDRIRQRLTQAAVCFRGLAEPAADDHVLRALLQAVGDGAPREAAAFQLAQAAESMDEAAIHTLDAWCQRMLREHAVDGLGGMPAEVLPDPRELLAQAARDWWRRQVYPLSASAWQGVSAVWATVDALVDDVQGQSEDLRASLETAAGHAATPPDLAPAIETVLDRLAQLKNGWPARVQRLREWFERPAVSAALSRSKIKLASQAQWLEALASWAVTPGQQDPGLSDTAIARLTPAGLLDAVKKGATLEVPPEIHDVVDLLDTLAAMPSWSAVLRPLALRGVTARLQWLKARIGQASYLDLQRRLDDALDEARHGDAARQLRARIVAQFPVALVDEFQDTSPLQLRILDRLYGMAANDPSHALVLIGDPKQSIYGFRGADIHSYLQARTATLGRHYALDTNYRSTPGVVAVVNALFGGAEARPGAGAFELGDEPAAEGSPAGRRLPFEPVQARGLDEALRARSPVAVTPLTVHLLDGERGVVEAREAAAQACARAIVAVLNDPEAVCARPDREPRALRAGDLAVLVRNRTEAALVRRALSQRRVPSVYLSDQDSVYATDEAADLLRLLRAMASPREPAAVRAAMASALIGLSAADLLALADDEARVDAWTAHFIELHALWQTQGVLAAVRRALHLFGLPARWLAQPQGERRLTNVLHLAELMQREQARVSGPAALVRGLAAELLAAQEGRAGGDDALVRLESDADRVQVVTVHKSKGLEYPIVFLPFATHVRTAARGGVEPLRADADGAPGSLREWRDEERAAEEAARQQEELRLLYVALTRARHALWVGVAALTGRGALAPTLWHRSAWGRLISGPQPREAHAAVEDLRAWVNAQVKAQVNAQADVRLEIEALPDEGAPTAPVEPLVPRAAATPLAPMQPYRGDFDRLWGIASYSALVRDIGSGGGRAAASAPVSGVATVTALRDDETDQADDATGLAAAAALSAEAVRAAHTPAAVEPWHAFPRGAWAGTFLHGVLESMAMERFSAPDTPQRDAALRRRCERQGWGAHAETVVAWMRRITTQPLPPLGVPLSQVARVLPEMEFWLPADGLDAARLDAACRAHLWPGEPRPALPERRLHGLLMGFADLVIEHDGRYWVLDHKSNALGADDSHYGPPALQAAMREHRYDVQAVLYLLALHRLLRSRLGASYEPQRQLGGAIYLFLRGIGAPDAGCCTLAPPWPVIEMLDAALSEQTTQRAGGASAQEPAR